MLLLIVTVLISGCNVEVPKITTVINAEPFNEKYYLYKDLNAKDIEYLNSRLKSEDKLTVYSAGLILGRYYIKNNEVEKGADLIKKYNDPSYLTVYMKYASYIWSYDAALRITDNKLAEKSLNNMNSIKEEDSFKRILVKYCNDENIRGSIDNLYDECIASRYTDEFINAATTKKIVDEKSKEKDEPGVDKNKNEIIVDVLNLNKNFDMFQGMVLLISENKLPIKINTATDDNTSNGDVLVNAETGTIVQNGNIIDFMPNYNEQLIQEIETLKNKGFNYYAVLYPTSYEKNKSVIKDQFNEGDKVFFINYEMSSLQHELKVLQEKAEDKSIGIIILGEADKHFYPVSLLKLYTVENKKQIIIIADSINDNYFDDRYVEYFEDITLVSTIPLINTETIENIKIKYEENTGKQPTLSAFVGYDVAQFINRYHFAMSDTLKNDYVTNISDIDGTNVIRTSKRYRINKRNKSLKEIN